MDVTAERKDTFEIPAANLPRLTTRIEALAKRATKLGGTVGMEMLGTREVERMTAYGWKTTDTLHIVRITGEAPSLNGWSFLATLQHASDLGNIVRTVPGVSLPEKYRNSKTCAPCLAREEINRWESQRKSPGSKISGRAPSATAAASSPSSGTASTTPNRISDPAASPIVTSPWNQSSLTSPNASRSADDATWQKTAVQPISPSTHVPSATSNPNRASNAGSPINRSGVVDAAIAPSATTYELANQPCDCYGPSRCDQCKAKRDRTESFIVMHTDGRMAQVGRTCLKDFLGHADPYKLASLATILAEAAALSDEEWGGGERGSLNINTDEYLAFVTASIERFGWVPKSKANEWGKTATAGDAAMEMSWAWEHGDEIKSADANGDIVYLNNRNIIEKHYIPTAKQADRAATALAWTRDYLDTKHASGASLSDYEHNLRIVVAQTHMIERTMGLAASAISFYDRHQEYLREQAGKQQTNAQAASTSEWIGTIGQRMDIPDVKTIRVREIDGQYGCTFVYTLETAEGNRLTWFSSRDILEVGTTRNLTATIKDHTTYQDIKQTVITRAVPERTDEEFVSDIVMAFNVGSASEFKGIEARHADAIISAVNAVDPNWRVEGIQSKSTKKFTIRRIA